VRSPRLMSGSSSMACRASSIVLVDRIVRPSPTRTPSSMNGPDAQRRVQRRMLGEHVARFCLRLLIVT
jgi:hypothetical protein